MRRGSRGVSKAAARPTAVPTVNRIGEISVEGPDPTVTVRAPPAAFEAMVRFAVSWVALLTVTELTVTPAPKLTGGTADAEKFVFVPPMTTFRVLPTPPDAGVNDVS